MKVSEKAKELIGDFSTATEQTALNPTVAAFNLYCVTREDLEDYIAELEAQIIDLDTEYTKLLRSDYSQTIVELEAKIAELEAAQRWIPVSERLPEVKNGDDKEYDVVLTYPFRREVIVGTWRSDTLDESGKRRWFDCLSDDYGPEEVTELVTHWRERPTPPEESKK